MVPRKREVPPGFSGFKTASTVQLPDAVAVMDPFYVVRLRGDAMDQCRRRVQQDLHGHRGRTGDPLYAGRRTLHTGEELLTDRQRERLRALFAVAEHVEVEATLGLGAPTSRGDYQRVVAAYRHPDRTTGKTLLQAVVESLTTGVPAALVELRTLGRTLAKRAADVLAYLSRTGFSGGSEVTFRR